MTGLRRVFMLAWLVAGVLLGMPRAHAYITPVQGVTNFTDTVTWGGKTRTALFFKPTASSTAKVPMLVMLHYRGGDAEGMAYLTSVSELVRDYGIWVVLPQAQSGKDWNNDPASDNGVDDVGYLSQVIDSAVSRFPIDPKRVYMTGYSYGGFMTLRFACERPAKIAAAATVAAQFFKSENAVCNPSLGVPMMMINGTSDSRTKYDSTLGVLTVPATAARWATIDGCPASPRRTSLPDIANDKTTVVLDTYLGCATGEVDLYTINGGGHTWPGSDSNCGLCGRTSYDIDGTHAVWEFVKRFTR